jgi:drug/metabolite transporter (DMT)-like permease
MKSVSEKKAITALILITILWGLTFPVIKDSVQVIAPFTFIAIRFILGWFFIHLAGTKIKSLSRRLDHQGKKERQAGIWVGLVLFAGYSLQTFGLRYTSSSNAGFLTGLSVVIVPLLLMLKGHRVGGYSWFGIILSVFGVGLLSLNESLQFNFGDLLVIACAIAFGMHIVLVGHYAKKYDTVRLAKNQILVCAILSSISALLLEHREFEIGKLLTTSALISLLFCGLIATGLAFLVQNVFQKYTTPVKVALIFTCEPVFAALFAVWLASETMTNLQVFGGVLMVFAMIVAEVGPSIVSNLFKYPHR